MELTTHLYRALCSGPCYLSRYILWFSSPVFHRAAQVLAPSSSMSTLVSCLQWIPIGTSIRKSKNRWLFVEFPFVYILIYTGNLILRVSHPVSTQKHIMWPIYAIKRDQMLKTEYLNELQTKNYVQKLLNRFNLVLSKHEKTAICLQTILGQKKKCNLLTMLFTVNYLPGSV